MTHPENFAMVAAPRKKATSEQGTGSVMTAMREFYHTVELDDLSKAAQKEVNALATTTDDEDHPLWSLCYDMYKVSNFLNSNIQRIVVASSKDYAASIQDALREEDIFDRNSQMYNAIKDKDEKEEFLEKMTNQNWTTLYGLMMDSFVIKPEGKDYAIHFTPGSNPRKLKTIEQNAGRYTDSYSLDRYYASKIGSGSQILIDAEANAKYAFERISKLAKTDLEKLGKKRVEIELPLDYDFGVLFKDYVLGREGIELVRSKISDQWLKFKSRWTLSVVIGYKAKTPVTSYLAKLNMIEIAVLPVVRISQEAAMYVTQAKDVDSVKLGTLHAWVKYWNKDIYDNRDDEVSTVNSLLDNFHFSQKKETLGIRSRESRSDEHSGMFINFEGRYCYAPSTNDVDESAIVAYEGLYDKIVQLSSDANEPLDLSIDADLDYIEDVNLRTALEDMIAKVNSFQSMPLISNWDLNICASIEPNDPTSLNTVNIIGGARPNIVGTAELLQDRVTSSMQYMIPGNKNQYAFTTSQSVAELPIKRSLASIYAFLRLNGKVDDIEEYLNQAAISIHGRTLQADDFEFGVYHKVDTSLRAVMSEDCSKIGANSALTKTDSEHIEYLLDDISDFGIARSRLSDKHVPFIKEYNRFKHFYTAWAQLFSLCDSQLLRKWARQRHTDSGSTEDFDIQDSPFYVDTVSGKTHELSVFARQYVVGQAFARLCYRMLNYIRETKNIVFTFDETIDKPVIGRSPALPQFNEICENVMPFLATFGYFINNSKAIIKQAEEEQQRFVLDPNKEIPEVPGGKAGFSAFLHQASGLKLLANEPKVAFLDFAPGGGKTATGLAECAMLLGKGKIKLPLIVAPQNLIKNWIADLNSVVTEFKYNCIPITSATVDKWGEKKMAQMVKNSPPNTIFYTDMSFIGVWSRKLNIKFLNHEIAIYSNLEWMKQFDWDYILIDESHFLKNAKGTGGGSVRSRLFAELTLADCVKYLRLASGTIISKDVDDIIGQARLFDPSIFRTHSDFVDMYSESSTPGDWSPDAAEKIRARLSKYCAVARAKRKDWAYALPIPRDEHPNEWLVTMDDEFRTVYEHVCRSTIEAMKDDEELMTKLKKSKGSVDDALDLEDVSGDDEEEESDSLSGKLRVYLDRIEQFVNAPEADPLNGWNGLDFKKLNPPKMDKLVSLLDKHFAEENSGKVIIFVRHIASVYGIINRLPPKYREMAIDYHGSIKSNLNQFRYNDDVKILIGVEMSMNTGENLQIASRIIRMELPWAAGDVEQAIARVFRPDFNNKYNRLYIDSDWILVDDSLEIPKMCRLISSTLRKVQFDEYGSDNSNYRDLPFLKSMTMDLEKFLDPVKAVRRHEQVVEYFDAYYQLASIQYNEFIAERSKYIDETGALLKNPFVPIKASAPLKGSKSLLFTPIVPNQNFVNDADADGLEPFNQWIMEQKELLNDPSKLVDETVLVYSEFGYGYIYSVSARSKKGQVPKSVTVMFSYGETIAVPTDSLYVSTSTKPSVKVEKAKKYFGKNHKLTSQPKYIGADPRDTVGLLYRDANGNYVEYIKGVDNETTEVAPAPTAPKLAPAKKVPLQVAKPKVEETEDDEDSYVPDNTGDDGQLFASLCVISDSLFLAFNAKDPDAAPLKALKFSRVKPFLGIEIKNLIEYDAALAFITKNFDIVDKEGKFEALRKRFSNKTKLFRGQFNAEDNKFLVLNYKPVKNPKNLKLYFIVEDKKLFLVFNIESNIEAYNFLKGKKPKGVNDKFVKYESMLVREVTSKRAALSVLTKANKVAKIVNFDQIVTAIGELTIA